VSRKAAKKAVHASSGMTGTPAAQFEPLLTKHVRERDIIGPVRAATSKVSEIMDTVIAMVGRSSSR
jgi:hypothetical protein